jgi:hypothetical protein
LYGQHVDQGIGSRPEWISDAQVVSEALALLREDLDHLSLLIDQSANRR